MRAKRTDANHQAIRDRYREYGWEVMDTSHVGDGFPDLIAFKRLRLEFVEVKNGEQPPSKQRLTKDEESVHRLFARYGYPIRIVTSVDQVTP